MSLDSIEELLGLASPSLGEAYPFSGSMSDHPKKLNSLLSRRNGFYAFNGALLVRRTGTTKQGVLSLQEWNDTNLWTGTYKGMCDGLYFFAEDIFGHQFALAGDSILGFDPETGDTHKLAGSLEEWATVLLSDIDYLTGRPTALQWLNAHGEIGHGFRLVPKVPFVLGGEFETRNLYPGRDFEAMRVRGAIALQIRDLPNGAQIELDIVD